MNIPVKLRAERRAAPHSIVCLLLIFWGVTGTARGQSVPACFQTPPLLAGDGSFVLAQTTPPCDELNTLLGITSEKDIAWITGTGLNAIIGLSRGGFAPDSYTVEFHVSPQFGKVFTAGRNDLVRFGNDGGRAQRGQWWTTLEAVTNSSGMLDNASQLEDLLALPESTVPHAIAYSDTIATGSTAYFGIVSAGFGHNGGAVQFWFPSQDAISAKKIDPIVQ
jgi:hypothetical protein